MAKKHPMQPICRDTIRFKENKIVSFLLETSTADLNTLACMDFSDEDHMQLAQLIGYSVSGYGDLSYASEKSVKKADKRAAKLMRNSRGSK